MPNKYYNYVKTGLPIITCHRCGNKTQSTSPNQKYCLNDLCQKEKRKLQQQKSYKEKRKDLPLYKECLTCGKKFNFQKHKKYCGEHSPPQSGRGI
jgi:hypothetical protein